MSTADPSPRLRDRPFVAAAVWLLSTCGAANEIVPASVAPLLAPELGVEPGAVGWLVSIMFAAAIVMSIPMERLSERLTARTLLIAAALIMLVSGGVSWLLVADGGYWLLIGVRFLFGVGFILAWNAGVEVFGHFANPATATGLFTASAPVGFAIGHATGPQIASRWGVDVVFLAYTFVIVAPLGVLLVNRSIPDARAIDSGSFSSAEYLTLLRVGRVRAVIVLGFVAYSLYLFVNSWMPSYLSTQLGYSVAQSGLIVAGFPLVGALSRTLGGVIADRLFGGRPRPVILVSFLVTTGLVTVLPFPDGIVVVTLLLVAAGFFVQLGLGIVYSYVPDLVPPGQVPAGVALVTTVGMFGAFTAPLAAASLASTFNATGAAFAYAVGLSACGIIVAWFGIGR